MAVFQKRMNTHLLLNKAEIGRFEALELKLCVIVKPI